MTDSIYKQIVKPINQCSLTGLELQVTSERIGDNRITIYKDSYKQWRITLKDIKSNTIVSAILFDQFKVIRFKYTIPDYRGNGYTKQLFAYMEYKLKQQFRHSSNLTDAGKAAI